MPELLAPASAYRAWGGAFWVVEAPGPIGAQIIGTIALRDSARPRIVELQKLYVARRARNNGVGGFLCGLVERAAWARGARTVELWSDVKLHEAHCCYEGRGYVRGGELKTYDDTSATVRFYYRKELDASTPDPLPGCNPSRDPGPWRVRVRGWERAHAGPGELRPAGA
jgi:GNAT superfamily N-acetyltransferase